MVEIKVLVQWNGHQPMSVLGRLADILDISRSMPPGHSPSSLYLSHDGTSYSRKEVWLDSHAKVPISGISIQPDLLPCDPNIGTTSQDPGDHSVPPGSTYVADPVKFVCGNRN